MKEQLEKLLREIENKETRGGGLTTYEEGMKDILSAVVNENGYEIEELIQEFQG